MLRLAQRPLRPGRRDVDRVVGAIGVEDARHALAERVVDAVGMVDVDAEPARREELDREHLDAGHARLDRGCDLVLQRPFSWRRSSSSRSSQQKWARRAHFVKPVKCGAARIAPLRSRPSARVRRARLRPTTSTAPAMRATLATGSRRTDRAERDREEDARLADGGDRGRRRERQSRENERVRGEREHRRRRASASRARRGHAATRPVATCHASATSATGARTSSRYGITRRVLDSLLVDEGVPGDRRADREREHTPRASVSPLSPRTRRIPPPTSTTPSACTQPTVAPTTAAPASTSTGALPARSGRRGSDPSGCTRSSAARSTRSRGAPTSRSTERAAASTSHVAAATRREQQRRTTASATVVAAATSRRERAGRSSRRAARPRRARARTPRAARYASRTIVTGPSFASATSMRAPKTPLDTLANSSSAPEGGDAAMKTADGCIRVSRLAGRNGESFILPDEQRAAIEARARVDYSERAILVGPFDPSRRSVVSRSCGVCAVLSTVR